MFDIKYQRYEKKKFHKRTFYVLITIDTTVDLVENLDNSTGEQKIWKAEKKYRRSKRNTVYAYNNEKENNTSSETQQNKQLHSRKKRTRKL